MTREPPRVPPHMDVNPAAWLSGTIAHISRRARVSLPRHAVEPEARKPVPSYLEGDGLGLRSVCKHYAQLCVTLRRRSASYGLV